MSNSSRWYVMGLSYGRLALNRWWYRDKEANHVHGINFFRRWAVLRCSPISRRLTSILNMLHYSFLIKYCDTVYEHLPWRSQNAERWWMPAHSCVLHWWSQAPQGGSSLFPQPARHTENLGKSMWCHAPVAVKGKVVYTSSMVFFIRELYTRNSGKAKFKVYLKCSGKNTNSSAVLMLYIIFTSAIRL